MPREAGEYFLKPLDRFGFTLIELIVVLVIIGILAGVALPRYVDMTSTANQAATKEGLSAVRSALVIRYGENLAFPSSLSVTDFVGNVYPTNKMNNKTGLAVVSSAASGTATDGTNGYWYIVSSGQAGAYSDGTTNTSSW